MKDSTMRPYEIKIFISSVSTDRDLAFDYPLLSENTKVTLIIAAGLYASFEQEVSSLGGGLPFESSRFEQVSTLEFWATDLEEPHTPLGVLTLVYRPVSGQEERVAYVGRLYVCSGYRKRGIGSSLIEAVVAHIRRESRCSIPAKLELILPSEQWGTLNFFQRCGFREMRGSLNRNHFRLEYPTPSVPC